MLGRLSAAAAAVSLAAAGIAAPAMAGPTGPCTLNNGFALEIPAPDNSGYVLVDVAFTWDGVSTKVPGCDGQVTSLRTRNTGAMTAWAILPDKKKPPLWVQINPGTDVTITARGTLNNLGLASASDVRTVTLVFTQPS